MATFTKGPWVWDGDDLLSPTEAEYVIVTACTDDTRASAYISCDDADRTLIAAAPTMAMYIKRRADEGDAEARAIWEVACGNAP